MQIKRLILPTKLDTTFDFEPLKQLKELESIEIYDHPKLTVENGALILKEKKQVVFYTPKYEQKVLDLTSLKTPVESVYFGSFKNAENLEKIILPESVKEIGDFTFEGCENLTEVVAPSVKQVGNYAFSNCKKLEKFDFSNLTHIGVNAFENCYRLKEINLSNAKRIADKAFAGCEKLAMVEIPNGVITLGERVFEGCSNRLRIRIPNLDVLPHSFCPHAALCFAEDGGSPEDPRYENYGQYLKAHAEKMAVFAVKHGVLIAMLCREKWIKAKSMEVFMTAAEQTGDGEVIAMLLDYQHNQLTAREKAQVEKAKEKQREKELSFLEE